MAFVAVPYFIYASNESKPVLARDLGDCRENEFKFVERIWTRYFRQNRSRSPEKKGEMQL